MQDKPTVVCGDSQSPAFNRPPDAANIAAERDFLLARATAGPDAAWIGTSSNALVLAAIHETGMPPSGQWPRDKGDLGRCEETLSRAPEHLKDMMRPIVERWQRHVSEGGLYCRDCDNSIGHWNTRDGLCPACYEASSS